MKKLSEIFKIALVHLEQEMYVCHSLDRAEELEEITEEEYKFARDQIAQWIGYSGGATIPLYLRMQGIHEDFESYTDLRHLVMQAWIDKLESEGK